MSMPPGSRSFDSVFRGAVAQALFAFAHLAFCDHIGKFTDEQLLEMIRSLKGIEGYPTDAQLAAIVRGAMISGK
jgi:hypothetical protein